MRRIVFTVSLLILFIQAAIAQVSISGTIKDTDSGETLIGANIVLKGTSIGTVSDINGNYTLKVSQQGDYSVDVSYVGYKSISKQVKVSTKNLILNFDLTADIEIDEVTVVADIAKNRETPVAFTNVLPSKLQEEIAGRDIPMVLNTTPGVYATAMGGGDGDARITIRGFSQRNVAVMLDGIPVNDMENGWVYWSNWFGLDGVTRNIQVQRGLGASKLALPSVGGTINIITKGVESKAEKSISQSVDLYGKLQTSLSYTSGALEKGWGVTAAFSYKSGPSWVDKMDTKGYFYYLKIDKRWKNHISSISAMGAPQQHDQRSYTRTIGRYDSNYAKKVGVDTLSAINNMGIGYNQHWGYLKRDRFDSLAPRQVLNEKINVYHKPQFSIRDYWSIGDMISISNVFYLSLGTGGGDRTRSSLKETELVTDPNADDYGQINWQAIYNTNCKPIQDPFQGEKYPIDYQYSDSLLYATNYLTRANNDHIWFGYLGTGTYKFDDMLTVSGGVDLRSYTGIHYMTITDLLGGDYTVDDDDTRVDYTSNPQAAMKYVGDTIYYYNKGLARWGGLFGQAEYKTDLISTFINVSAAYIAYRKIDYFEDLTSPWVYTPSFTFKGGANYNISEKSNLFMNLGYLSKTRDFKYFFVGNSAVLRNDVENEKVKAIEVGYHFGSQKFSANVNGYMTRWENKPTDRAYATYLLKPGDIDYKTDDPTKNTVRVYADIPGMDAFHMGVELDFVYKILSNLEFQGLVSVGDWKWDKQINGLQYFNDDTDNPVNYIFDFNAKGIHVGDAAQTQVAASIRYEPIKNLYISGRVTYFDRYYAEFSPEATTDDNGNPVDSWKLPSYTLVDTHIGYNFRVKSINKLRFSWKVSILNVLNTKYISDAANNDSYSELPFTDFDAKSATVFFGAPRSISTTLQISF